MKFDYSTCTEDCPKEKELDWLEQIFGKREKFSLNLFLEDTINQFVKQTLVRPQSDFAKILEKIKHV